MSEAFLQTVADWQRSGHRGLRIPHCPSCRVSTWATWEELDAGASESVVAVARRLMCTECGQTPAGLAVVVCSGPLQ
jgi:hypothetical protein